MAFSQRQGRPLWAVCKGLFPQSDRRCPLDCSGGRFLSLFCENEKSTTKGPRVVETRATYCLRFYHPDSLSKFPAGMSRFVLSAEIPPLRLAICQALFFRLLGSPSGKPPGFFVFQVMPAPLATLPGRGGRRGCLEPK